MSLLMESWLSPLSNQEEAGAINESIADIFGIMYKRHQLQQKDWNIGDLRNLTERVSLRDPKSSTDNGWTHHNSRVLSHVFSLASTNLEGQGYDPQDALLLDIWFSSVKELSDTEKTFEGFKAKTIQIGFRIAGEPFQKVIREAWDSVRLKPLTETPLKRGSAQNQNQG